MTTYQLGDKVRVAKDNVHPDTSAFIGREGVIVELSPSGKMARIKLPEDSSQRFYLDDLEKVEQS